MTFALDSDTTTFAYYESHGIRERIATERLAANGVHITAMTRVEVLRGRLEAIRKATDGRTLARAVDGLRATEEYLGEFEVLPFDAASVALFDQIRTDKRLGKVDHDDKLIACIVMAHKATLVTRNIKHFALIPGFTVGKNLVNWTD